ncbi:MAG: RHS repeat-associated core domain-containing protein [Chitinophagaceae bacterium]|nr:RHS repeat-associated core domain-containing protein [Chitinophagaceae bacterium]
MAGDKIDIFGKSYYFQNNTGGTGANSAIPIIDILTGLLGGPTGGAAAATHGGITASQLSGIGDVTSGISSLLTNQTTDAAAAPTVPKAYINYIFFDEQFHVVKDALGNIQAAGDKVGTNSVVKSHAITGKTALKSGYVYIYVSNESPVNVFFDNLHVIHTRGAILEETHYYPFGLTMQGISSKALAFGNPENKRGYNGNEIQNKEFSDGSGLEFYDFNARTYDQQVGRFIQIDPLSDEEDQEGLSPYHFSFNNPVRYNDPDGKCPNCATAGIGAVLGGLIGGGIEIASQLYNNGSVSNWSAVGGAALQGAVTGAAAGFTGGASLLTTAAVSGGANVVGGAANRAIQGQGTTLTNVVTDATVGAVLGAGGKMVGNAVNNGTNNLSNSAKGKLGEAVTEIKYGAQGYKSAGKAEVLTGGRTATGKPAKAIYDHKMTNVVTGKQITVESKFNGSTLTPNQAAAQSRVTTPGGLIIDRTTSQGLGNGAKAATVGTGAGVDAQRNKKP